jgi:hypothetical protein
MSEKQKFEMAAVAIDIYQKDKPTFEALRTLAVRLGRLVATEQRRVDDELFGESDG